MKLLVPVDGSASADHAIEYAIMLMQDYISAEIHIINVQPALSGDVTTFIAAETIADYHREQGEKETASARALLDTAGYDYIEHIGIGSIAETIASYVREQGIDHIIMGSHGRGAIANALLGSIATKLIHLLDVPVTLIK